jgi:hypothetical protein
MRLELRFTKSKSIRQITAIILKPRRGELRSPFDAMDLETKPLPNFKDVSIFKDLAIWEQKKAIAMTAYLF